MRSMPPSAYRCTRSVRRCRAAASSQYHGTPAIWPAISHTETSTVRPCSAAAARRRAASSSSVGPVSGYQPSASCSTWRKVRLVAAAPIRIGGPGRPSGRQAATNGVNEEYSPSWPTTSSDQRSRMTEVLFEHGAGFDGSTPLSISGPFQPYPRRSRPGHRTGRRGRPPWPGAAAGARPRAPRRSSRNVVVRAAAAVLVTKRSGSAGSQAPRPRHRGRRSRPGCRECCPGRCSQTRPPRPEGRRRGSRSSCRW